MSLMCPNCGHGYEPPTHPLTERQANIVRFISDQITQRGYAPSFTEIAARFRYRSLATVHEHLTTIERKGWIRRRFNESRAIEILAAPVPTPDGAAVPTHRAGHE